MHHAFTFLAFKETFDEKILAFSLRNQFIANQDGNNCQEKFLLYNKPWKRSKSRSGEFF